MGEVIDFTGNDWMRVAYDRGRKTAQEAGPALNEKILEMRRSIKHICDRYPELAAFGFSGMQDGGQIMSKKTPLAHIAKTSPNLAATIVSVAALMDWRDGNPPRYKPPENQAHPR